MVNALNWFEIPTVDIDRAAKFYGAIFDAEIAAFEMYPGFKMAMLPYEQGKGVGGAIVHGEGYTPSTEGAIVYLNGGADLSVVLDRIAPAGGTVVVPKTLISDDNGYMAFFLDTEGNKVGLHSNG